jgi:tRNA(adenine34) deaminase
MLQALVEADRAASLNEVPVGAVIALGDEIIARGHNTTEHDGCVVAHAETNAIRNAALYCKTWRLTDCIICVTLEPCTMCLGAIRLARIPTLVFGAGDSKQGAVGSLYDLSEDPRLGPPVRVIGGVRSRECQKILSDFFKAKR